MEENINHNLQPLPPYQRALLFVSGRNVPADLLVGGKDWAPLLVLLILGSSVLCDWFLVEPERYFSSWGFGFFFTDMFLISAFCYGVSRSSFCIVPFALLWSLVLEVYFILALVYYGVSVLLHHYPADDYALYFVLFFCAWFFLAMLSLLKPVLAGRVWDAVSGSVFFVLLMMLPSFYLGYAEEHFWYQHYVADTDAEENRIEDFEQVFFSQEKLLEDQLGQLAPGMKGQIDLFYLGFGSYASEAVFKKEVHYIKNMFESNPFSQGRSITLINHRDTLEETPLAILHNLKLALKGIAQKMNKDEDILFLYITTHGSEDHELSVSFHPFRFKDLTPALLRQALDESGIRWKVIVISACYSGGFVEPLKDGYSLIATAADAENKSFGCSDENEFTYYGEALFQDQLANNVSLLDAFPKAIESITEREKREKKEPSNPQLWLEPSIAERLQLFEMQQRNATK